MNPHCVVVSPSRTVNAFAFAVKSSHVQPGSGYFTPALSNSALSKVMNWNSAVVGTPHVPPFH